MTEISESNRLEPAEPTTNAEGIYDCPCCMSEDRWLSGNNIICDQCGLTERVAPPHETA